MSGVPVQTLADFETGGYDATGSDTAETVGRVRP
jgi:hypothetical protein